MGVLYWSYNNHGNRIFLHGNHHKCINLKWKTLAIRGDTRNENRSIYSDYQNNVYTDSYNTVRATVSETVIWYGLWKKIERNDGEK